MLAGPPSTTYRASKFVRRHRFGVAVAAAALILWLHLPSLWRCRRAGSPRNATARTAKPLPPSALTDFMTQMFKVSDPGETRGNSVTAREILDKASKDVDSGLANDPQLQAQMMNTMGTVYENLGLFGQAEPLLRHALEIRRQILGNSNKDTLKSMYHLSEVLTWKGRRRRGRKALPRVLRRPQDVLGPEHRDTLTSMNWLVWILFIEGQLS